MDETDRDLIKKLEDAEARLNAVETKLKAAEHELEGKSHEHSAKDSKRSRKTPFFGSKRILFLVVIGVVIALSALYILNLLPFGHSQVNNLVDPLQVSPTQTLDTLSLERLVNVIYPAGGFELPITWGGSVKQLIASGALNETTLIYSVLKSNETITPYEEEIMSGTYSGYVYINSSNAEFFLNVLWSIGVNDNNSIITKGPLSSYGNPYQYASTGGYLPLGRLKLAGLNLINLTAAQENEVMDVSAAAFRPCCDNPAMFPDCNHGAAELALIEMMAAQGYNESQIFTVLQRFLSEYFPQNMFEEAVIYAAHGINFSSVPANVTIGRSLFSASGQQNVAAYIQKYGLLQGGSSSSTSGSSNSCSA